MPQAVPTVLYAGAADLAAAQALAARLRAPLAELAAAQAARAEGHYLCYRDGGLKLLDAATLGKGGLQVEVDPRPGEQPSWPAPKKDLLATAVGKKTRDIVDATAGWAQDALALFRMGYQVRCIERSPVMAELIADGFRRLAGRDWMRRLDLQPPQLLAGNAIELLPALPVAPECVYLDPMFPPRRRKSALSRKSMTVLRDILGDDPDSTQLFQAAWQTATRRVVVKSPDYAEPLGGPPSEQYQGKLLRYDVYLKP